MSEYSVLGIIVVIFNIIGILFGLAGSLWLMEDGISDTIGCLALTALMSLGLFYLSVSYVSNHARVTERAVIGNNVVFVVEGELKTYSDIETLKNMGTISFKKVQGYNIFDRKTTMSIERNDAK